MPNDIGTKQNSPEALVLLRGVRRAYGKAKLLSKIQLGLSISVVVASPLAAHFAPEAKAYVALYGAFILLVDLLFLEPAAKKNHEAGAKIQELFDERVLAFPWRVRHRPEPGMHQSLAKEHARSGEKVSSLKDWYPAVVSRLPLEQARLVCQRSNMKWDAELREHVWKLYLGALLVLAFGALLYAKIRGLPLDAAIVEVLMPVVPVGVRLAKRLVDHKAAAESSDQAKQAVDRLWSRVATGALTSVQLDDEARTLQEDIYERRLRSPQVPEFLYNLTMRGSEEDMTAAAKDMVDEAERAPPASTAA